MPQPLREPKDRLSVLIVTADDMTGELIKHALTRGRNGFVVETVNGDSQKVITQIGSRRPGIALISVELEDGPQAGLKVLQKLTGAHRTPCIILSCSKAHCIHRPACVIGAFRAGARGIFHRSQGLKALSKCIEVVNKGQIWVGNEDLEHLLLNLADVNPIELKDSSGTPLLTRREEDVVRLVADGLKNREIAAKLNVAEHSIRNYLYKIFDKLGVSTRVELILYVFSHRGQNN